MEILARKSFFSIELWPAEHFFFRMWPSDKFEFETPGVHGTQESQFQLMLLLNSFLANLSFTLCFLRIRFRFVDYLIGNPVYLISYAGEIFQKAKFSLEKRSKKSLVGQNTFRGPNPYVWPVE